MLRYPHDTIGLESHTKRMYHGAIEIFVCEFGYTLGISPTRRERKMQEHLSEFELLRARLLLEEGRVDEALTILEVMKPVDKKQQQDIAYLLGWHYIQKKQWDEALLVLAPLAQVPFEEKINTLLERERLVASLLHLGEAATNLSHYEDAALHFTACLKVLHDRRIHMPSVRIKARSSLATTCIRRGLYSVAIHHYNEAVRISQHYNRNDELAHIYHGLCDAYRNIGDFACAMTVGQEALRLSRQQADREMEACVQNHLGRISFLLGEYRVASDHYTEALAIAMDCHDPTMAMFNWVALAEVRLAEGRLEEARRSCQLALETMECSHIAQMRGSAYQAVGNVTYEEARQVQGAQRHTLLEEAACWYRKASEHFSPTQTSAERAEAFKRWAQTLEEMGREREALDVLHTGYEALFKKRSRSSPESSFALSHG